MYFFSFYVIIVEKIAYQYAILRTHIEWVPLSESGKSCEVRIYSVNTSKVYFYFLKMVIGWMRNCLLKFTVEVGNLKGNEAYPTCEKEAKGLVFIYKHLTMHEQEF